MKPNLRYLGRRRIGGIIIAFTTPELRDSYGNYWTRDTDLGLQRYNVRPLYFQHRGDMVEAGLIRSEDLMLTDKGLYMEVDVIENPAGDACLALVMAERGHYSTGVMPGSWREANDGWVELWPWVEASVTDRPATRDGLTRAELVYRSLGLDAEIGEGENLMLVRGPIFADSFVPVTPFSRSDGEQLSPEMAPPAAGGNGAAAAAPPPAPAVVTADQAAQILAELATLRQQIGDQPGRVLRPSPLPAALHPPAPAVQVGHKFDNISLGALAFRSKLMMDAGKLKGDDRTEVIRALAGKMARQVKVDQGISDADLARGAVRMIDPEAHQVWGPHIRADEAMMSTYANYGDELVPTLLNSAVWYHFMLEARVLNALNKFQMPSNPYDWPTITGGPTVRAVAELADQSSFSIPASNIPVTKIGTSKVTFSAGGMGVMVLGSGQLFEDAGMDVSQVWFNQIMRQMASAIDYVLINGDESATATNISHFGTDPTTTAYDKILIVDGLRHMAVGASDSVAEATFAVTSPGVLRALMGARGINGIDPRGLVMITDPGVYYKALALTSYQTISSVPPSMATLLTGEVGQISGVPMIVADELENTNASGQIEDSHDSTKGSFLVVRRDNVMVGYCRDVVIELVKVPGTDGFACWTTVRLDVQQLEAGNVAYGYNTTI